MNILIYILPQKMELFIGKYITNYEILLLWNLYYNLDSYFRVLQFNPKLIQLTLINENSINDSLKEITKEIKCEQLFNGFSSDEVSYVSMLKCVKIYLTWSVFFMIYECYELCR